LEEIGGYAFMSAKKLSSITIPESVHTIGEYAFYDTAVLMVALENVATIGEYAFAKTKIREIALANGASIGEGAFFECENLATVNNLENVSKIGAEAFRKTAITSVKLTNVEELGDYAFGESKITAVDFGTEGKLTKLGENPFYGCQIDTFGIKTEKEFNQNLSETLVKNDYEVSETIKVMGGVLYQIVPNGLVLISYPAGDKATSFVVPEGVVRIGGSAFRATTLESVTLPSTLKALGDKAFYECENLLVVVFQSYKAPILEEEYDEYYITYENMPLTGNYYGYEGLGVLPFYMWNIASNYNNFFFGANFLDYVGKVDRTLVMVKPVNGQNYDTFILSKYFAATIEGASAPTQDTANVIAKIAALPTKITLEHESLVVAARAAFNSISSYEQQALVTNLAKLESAESMINYLKLKEEQNKPTTDVPQKPEKKDEGCGSSTATWSVAVVLVLATVAVALRSRKENTVSADDSANDK
jgi:hypothetical protein